MTTSHGSESVAKPQRRKICVVLALLGLGSRTVAWAQTSTDSRPSLERFIQTAKLRSQARLWVSDFTDIAERPNHPLHALVAQIQNADESQLLALLVKTFQAVSEEDANQLVVLLATPLGQWVVQSSLWGRKSIGKPNFDPSKDSEGAPRRLSNMEIQAVQAMGNTPSWQALRRAGAASMFGSELMTVLDWPKFVDLLWERFES
jgi:hypothetical protein